jgi:hypothetical protein
VEADMLEGQAELNTWMKREETRIAQKIKNTWIGHGEVNASFFATLQTRKRNIINSMNLPDGRMLSTPEEIHNEAVVHFADFLGRRASVSVLSLSDIIQEEVREAENLNLCRSPTKQEIKDALFDIPINSSPGPDGFTSGFFQHCWDFIQTDLVEAVRDFFVGTAFLRYYTTSFLVLIPKVPDPCSFDKFRPISLCSVVYKICSKLIVNRLSAALCRLVSEEQGAFLPGRSIFENISLTQELVQDINKPIRGGNIMIKIDMAKDYDTVD